MKKDIQKEQFYEEFIPRALKEDIEDGDHTSLACIPSDVRSKAKLFVKDVGIRFKFLFILKSIQ